MGTPAPGGQGDEDSWAEELERVAWKRQEDTTEDVKTWVPEEGGPDVSNAAESSVR